MMLLETLYIIVIMLLALYGLTTLYLVGVHTRKARGRITPEQHRIPPKSEAHLGACESPRVTVQLPIYNERYVAVRLIEAVCRFEWPKPCLHIQLLDDSTDDTTEIISMAIEKLRSNGLSIAHIHRTDRKGFKAGALQQGLAKTRAEFIAIFDADFVPPPDFLQRTIPIFADPQVGCVQTRWGHLNAEMNDFTRVQSLGIDGHFLVEQPTRHRMGAMLNFNGTAGVWRRTCLDAAGGWRCDTLTEDLDLSYRAQLAGWNIIYTADVVVPAEIPVQIEAFKRQQFRWAKGSIQTARKLALRLACASEPLWRKILGFLHLTNYAVHPLMLLNLLLLLPITWSASYWLKLSSIFTIAAVGPPLLYWSAFSESKLPFNVRVKRLALLMALGTGVSLSNTCAVVQGLSGETGSFQRTPKFASSSQDRDWVRRQYILPANSLLWLEITLALYAVSILCYCLVAHIWWTIPWVLLYATGYTYVSTVAIRQAAAIRQQYGKNPPADRGISPQRPILRRPRTS